MTAPVHKYKYNLAFSTFSSMLGQGCHHLNWLLQKEEETNGVYVSYIEVWLHAALQMKCRARQRRPRKDILHQIPIIGRLIWLQICAQQLAFVFCPNFLPVPSMISSRKAVIIGVIGTPPIRSNQLQFRGYNPSPNHLIWLLNK
jgi:hypothetical protein